MVLYTRITLLIWIRGDRLKACGIKRALMSAESTARATVKTYVPAYQKEIWESHAEELGMSQSEFVKTMVQAGRRNYTERDLEGTAPAADSDAEGTEAEDLAARVKDALASEGSLTWDALLAEVTDDVESRLEDALDGLQADNAVKYSGREGGYTLIDE